MRLNKLYKRVLILCCVLGPFIWLVFTADGQRRSDLVMLSLLTDREPMNLAFANLQSGFSEADFRANFPDLPLSCEDRQGHFGNRICASPIAAVNGTPAILVNLYFQDQQLNALKLVYQPSHRPYLLERMQFDLGAAGSSGGQGVHSWDTAHGRVLMEVDNADPKADQEPTLIWLSNPYLQKISSAN